MSVMHPSEKEQMLPAQTPIGLFHLLTTGLRLRGFINKLCVISDGEVLNHN